MFRMVMSGCRLPPAAEGHAGTCVPAHPGPGRSEGLIVSGDSFVALVALRGFDRHRRDWPCFEPGQRDRFAGDFARAVFAGLDPPQRRVDLRDQLALAVTGAKLDRPVGLAGGAVGDVGFADRPALQLRHRVARFAQNLVLPAEQLVAEIAELRRIHELLVCAGAIDVAAQTEAVVENLTESRRHNPSASSTRPGPLRKAGISSAGPESPGFCGLFPSAPIGEPEHQHKSLKRRLKPILESVPERDIFADPPPPPLDSFEPANRPGRRVLTTNGAEGPLAIRSPANRLCPLLGRERPQRAFGGYY